MAKMNVLIHAFNRGEVSAAALARVDQEKMRLAAETQENILPYVIGKGLFRPGTEYLGASRSNNKARYIPFIKRLTDTAIIEMTDGYIRVWVSDAVITRPSVSTAVSNGDMGSATDWTLTATNATATISGGLLTLACPNRGTTALAKQQVTVAGGDQGVEHALRIVVTRGPVIFECGSTDGGDEYITRSELDTGTHSLAFTPTGSFYIRFSSRLARQAIVDSCTVEAAGVLAIAAPWTEAQMWDICRDQSADVIFLAHESWQTRKIERRASRSWSLVLFKTDDGPFALQSSLDAKIKLTPAQPYGNTTLTATGPVFKSTDVGGLYRTESAGFDATFPLAADGAFTEPVRVSGVTPDNAVNIDISGTWVGTLRLQRSYDGPTTGFVSVAGTTYTVNGASTYTPTASFDNVEHWFRIGFSDTGDYTSGVASVRMRIGGIGASVDALAGASGNPGIYRVTAYSSETSVSVEVLNFPSSINAATSWRRGEWSDRRGWPSALTFHDGRLYFAAFDRIAGSVSDAYTSFDLDVEGDSGPVIRSIATSGMVPRCNGMVSLQRLLFLTEGSEVSARSSNFDAPMTPTDITLRDAGTVGAGRGPALKIDKHAAYIDSSEVNLHKVYYDFNSQDYETQPIAELNEDYGGSRITTIAFQRARRQPYIWGVRDDGEAFVVLYRPTQEVEAVVPILSDGADGLIEDVCVIRSRTEDRVYLSVKRTINGSTVRYLEKLCLHSEAIGAATTKLADAGTLTAGPVSSVTLAHLAAETGLVGWGTTGGVAGPITGLTANGSGVISLGATYTNVWVGLPYSGRYKSAKLAYAAEGGTALLQSKIVAQIGLLLANTHRDALNVGKDFDTLAAFTLKSSGGNALTDAQAVKSVHDNHGQPLGGSWLTDHRVCITVAAGYPATLLGLVVPVQTNER